MTDQKDRSRVGLLTGLSRGFAGLVIGVGCVVLVGWARDIAALKSLLPGWVAMKPNTALAFILIGIAMLLPSLLPATLSPKPPHFISLLARLCGLLAGLIGLLTLSEWAFGWDLGIDQRLFREAAGAVGTSIPGRMAPDTALCFLLLAAGPEIARGSRKTARTLFASAILGWLVAIVALAALLSYFTLVIGDASGWWGLTMMAVPTAIVFALLGAAMVCNAWGDPLGPRLTRFSRNLLMSAGLVVLLATVFALYVRSRKQVESAYEVRHQSFLLADELRESGNDLTRMARTYVVTRDPVYKRHFQDILDIRDGKKPRPENYWRPYWDLVLRDGPAPRPESRQSIPLLELMRKSGFTEEEFRKLAEAKANSDGLTVPEFEAMKLVESTGPQAEANRAKARLMMHDAKYHQAKAAVMGPINDFEVLVDERTLAAVETAKKHATALRYMFVGIGLALMSMLWLTYAALRDTLGGSVDEVYSQIARIGSGDFSSTIELKEGLENSVRGWLSVTQTRLSDSDRERTRVEAVIRDERDFSESLINSLPGILYLFDEQGRFRRWNTRFEEATGYSAAEVAGLSPLDLFEGDERQLIAERIQEVFLTGQSVAEAHLISRDGKQTPYYFTGVVTRIEDKQFLVGIGMDLTERRKAEAALRESEERFRLVVEAAPNGIVVVNEAGNITLVNEQTEKMFGYTRSEIVGQPIELLIPERLRADHPTQRRSFLAAPASRAMGAGRELFGQRRDGSEFPLEIGLSPITTRDGMAVLAAVVDVTERKQAEALLRESEEFNRRIIESSSDCIKVLDLDGNLLSMSEGGQRLLEIRDISRYLNSCWISFWKPEDQPRVREAVDAARAGGGGRFQAFCPSEAGNPRWWDVIVTPISGASGQVERLLSISRDISAQKQAEEEIRTLNAELEQRVVQRTAQLAASNKELEAFAYSVSHDLRAPLRAIDGFSRILVEDYSGKLDTEGLRLLNVVGANAQKTDQLIGDLLTLSRVTRDEMQPSRIDMTVMVQSIYNEIASAEVQERFEFSLTPLPEAAGDPTLIRQVWTNLLSNAIKFTMPRDERRIAIGGRAENGTNVYYVKDSGVGFNPNYTHKLFGAFQRLHKVEEFEGTGIGLAIVQRIVHRHGGRVWAEGKVGEGATFYFSL